MTDLCLIDSLSFVRDIYRRGQMQSLAEPWSS